MDIRFAEKKDLPQIIELCDEHAEYERAEFEVKNKAELLSEHIFGQNPSLKCLVVAQKKSIIGYATFMKQFSTWDADFYIYIDCLYLNANSRGLGLGSNLMEQVKEYAIAENCNVIQWQTPNFNRKAIDFYRKIGGTSKTKARFCLDILERQPKN